MKKSLIIGAVSAAALAFSTPSACAQIQKGEKSFGPKIGYVSHNKSAVAGLVFQYTFSQPLRISPEIGCAFRNNDEDAFLVDLNFHVPFGIVDSEKVAIYPLAGLAFNSWSRHGVKPDEADDVDVTTHTNRFGANLGAGFDLRCSSTLRLNLEAKYTLIKSYSALYLTAGISYVF